jgi:hypothetical protein
MFRWIATLIAAFTVFMTHSAVAQLGPSSRLLPSVSAPDPSIAWILALGFLALVVLRRTPSGPLD